MKINLNFGNQYFGPFTGNYDIFCIGFFKGENYFSLGLAILGFWIDVDFEK